jgi:1-deoxy-D-xylulose-5-phosphate reductoisomerase
MKKIAVLGSTGSIGLSALEVIRHHPQEFCAAGLSAHSNIELLARQVKEFRPDFVAVEDASCAKEIKSKTSGNTRIFIGSDGLAELARAKVIDRVLLAISGSAALAPLLSAIDSGKDVALANKEALVAAGPIIMKKAKEKKIKILPIDSEQSAIWQCLEGRDKASLKNIYLTASGGPFRKTSAAKLANVTISRVLKHPRWKMGKKVTVDSATLMNKGLELLEAMFLFGVPCDKIKILIHPEAIIHSMVEFIDAITLAQLSATDMRIPIQYALAYPKRLSSNSHPSVDFYKLGALHFEKPDFSRFPCLGLAYQAAEKLGTAPCVLNAANEACVEAFLEKNFFCLYT